MAPHFEDAIEFGRKEIYHDSPIVPEGAPEHRATDDFLTACDKTLGVPEQSARPAISPESRLWNAPEGDEKQAIFTRI